MRQECGVQIDPARVAGQVGAGQGSWVVGEVQLREAGAVGHDDIMAGVDSILLRQDELAQPVVAPQPVAEMAERAAHAAVGGRRHERRGVEDLRARVRVLAVFGEAGHRAERPSVGADWFPGQDPLDGGSERFVVRHAVAHGGRHAMIRQNHDVVAAAGGGPDHAQNFLDTGVGALEIAERLPAARSEVMPELIVLHECTVDDRHSEVEIQQDRHGLEFAHDDVAEDAQIREDAFGVRDVARELSPHPLPLLTEPFDDRLDQYPDHADRMERDEERHPGATKPAIH